MQRKTSLIVVISSLILIGGICLFARPKSDIDVPPAPAASQTALPADDKETQAMEAQAAYYARATQSANKKLDSNWKQEQAEVRSGENQVAHIVPVRPQNNPSTEQSAMPPSMPWPDPQINAPGSDEPQPASPQQASPNPMFGASSAQADVDSAREELKEAQDAIVDTRGFGKEPDHFETDRLEQAQLSLEGAENKLRQTQYR